MEDIRTLFPRLSEQQQARLARLGELYPTLNERVNVISRKDIGNLQQRHVLHSLLIGKIMDFVPGTEILDLGTGGGFPGVPLAILFPQVKFTLVDGTRKKIGVANEVINDLGLDNATARQQRAEEIKNQRFDFVVSRAVAGSDKLLLWSRRLLKSKQRNAMPNGIFAWKGGDSKKERALLPRGEYSEVFPLDHFANDDFFEGKYILYIQG